jgi:multidrug efflux pump subunit AcrB
MSFEIKYDNEGQPIRSPMPQFSETEVQTAPEVEQVVDNLSATEVPEDNSVTVDNVSADEKSDNASVRKSTPQESWRILREKAEKAEQRAQELERVIAQSYRREKKEHIPEERVHEEDLSINLEDDSLVEGKHLSKVDKKIRKLEQKLAQYEQNANLSSAELRLKSQYPDFDQVVSEENLANLKATYPEIAHTINTSTDLYSKAVSAYTMIKKLNIGDDSYIVEQQMAKKNSVKPKSLASISPAQSDSPLSKANAFANGVLTDELKASMLKEMNAYRNR